MTLLALKQRLAAPVIVAPMFLVSGPALVLATCGEGLVGSFPAHATRTPEELENWIDRIEAGLAERQRLEPERLPAPYAVNLVLHASNPRASGDLAICLRRRVPILLSSKGAPSREAVDGVHGYGGLILHDVAGRRHAEKATMSGVDGLIAVAQGAGGHTGTVNPFALMGEVRRVWSGPIALAGCISTGADVLAAEAMGADFAYIGTRFLATEESLAVPGHKDMVVADGAADVFFTAALDGAPANFLSRSLAAAGIDIRTLGSAPRGAIVPAHESKTRWRDIWSAGQGIGAVEAVVPAADLARRIVREYGQAREAMGVRLAAQGRSPY